MRIAKPRPSASGVAASCAALLASATPAFAQDGPELRRTIVEPVRDMFAGRAQDEMLTLALFLGTLLFAVMAAIALVRAKRALAKERAAHEEALGETKARADRADALLEAESQVLVVWDSTKSEPEIRLTPDRIGNLPAIRSEVLAFGKWLIPQAAAEAERLVGQLRTRGEGFNVMARTRVGGHVEIDGRTVGGRAVLRVRDLAGERAQLAEFHDRHKSLDREVKALREAIEALPVAVWMRGRDQHLRFANRACLAAAGASDMRALATGGVFSEAQMSELGAARRERGTGNGRIAVKKGNERRIYAVHETNAEEGSVGYALDVTELETARQERERQQRALAATLDKVATAVAVFDADKRVVIHNKAFHELWPVDEDFLAERPSLGELLDHLRANRRLPEQANYREWQRAMVSGRDAKGEEISAKPVLWHLPDGQVLRVARSANADGGVTFLFEDLTRTLDLEARFVALTHVQRETLESLAEAIAVFGSDGRLKLTNPAFARMWRLDPKALEDEPHIETVISWARVLYPSDEEWQELRAAVTGLADQRQPVTRRLERADGSVVDLRAAPLPDGATLAVFTDMTDTARVERVLRDHNEALIAASRIKNEFVHKVSYELRAPLTNIIGFTQLMSDDTAGPLNPRQREYADYILSSSSALLAIINDILDLATIDAGVLELELGDVDARVAAEAAAAGLADRLKEAGIRLDFDMPADIGTFRADEKRVRQVLFNLLSNAIGFSEPGQAVRLSCRRQDGEIVFTMTDEGRGIPEEVRRLVFERFESHALGTGHRGVGLGLSLVKSLVELHGGRVELRSEEGRGTTVSCHFPLRAPHRAVGSTGSVTQLEPRRAAALPPAEPAPSDSRTASTE
ncbi:PAS domain-containing sensor histidine kinase [Lutibaculum baratangense]|uniref:histidine kinase n=1 Tax=Lutibaculum baratangense AMV1 TaxID=631454 RepID=V4R229_9HYPH|nr:PAS domain-containing sensor histidine kinase [Lutibaculum baratangense]ESR25997.1 sensor [Lutibaculum baratangense AMV1]